GVTAAIAATVWLTIKPHTGAEATSPRQPAALETGAPAREPEFQFPPGVNINFVDATKSAGIHFQHFDGRSATQYIMDQTGSGLGWIDYDQDGLLDLFLVQGSTFLPPQRRGQGSGVRGQGTRDTGQPLTP